jgi:hypothetical protein
MKAFRFARRALSIGAVATLMAACGGSQLPSGAPGTTSQSAMVPARDSNMLYFSAFGAPNITIYGYTYPQWKLVRSFGEFLGLVNLCSDRAGDLFATNLGSVGMYSHDGKYVQTLSDGFWATGCAADPATGDLAVINESSRHERGASVSIFEKLHPPTKTFYDSQVAYFRSLSYDDRGDLFLDGLTRTHAPAFAVLPRGSKTLTDVTVRPKIERPATIAWDGSHFAVQPQFRNVVDRVEVSGSRGRVVGTTTLETCAPSDFFIVGGRLTADCRSIDIFDYPAGGKPIAVLKAARPDILSIALSK